MKSCIDGNHGYDNIYKSMHVSNSCKHVETLTASFMAWEDFLAVFRFAYPREID